MNYFKIQESLDQELTGCFRNPSDQFIMKQHLLTIQ